MISYDEAISIIEKYFNEIKLSISEVPLLDSLNFTLAEDIYSDINLPPFDTSSMDGYGIKYKENIDQWTVIGEISAGNYKDISIRDNEAVSIMTGSKLPPGVDSIIQIENVKVNDNHIKLNENVNIQKGDNVRFCGEDLKKDQLAITKNTLIKPKNISLAAACGKKNIQVYAPLKIVALSSGDELIPIESVPVNDQIRCSNIYSLIALIKEINMIPINYGIVKDNKKIMKDALYSILNDDIDILITTGAVSVGKYDFLKEMLEDLGSETIFWKVNIKPGKPLLFSIFKKPEKNILIFGLPGNPASCFVGFHLFIKPFIQKLYHNYKNPEFNAVLKNYIFTQDRRRQFIRSLYSFDENKKKYFVEELGMQSSGNMYNLNNANCLIVLEENLYEKKKGELVKCIEI
ncbi:MAG: molybdopterin molybdotransferase MoeA [FCB group bacterium]|jgi:molybdopterin molybdotransferase